LEAGRKDMLGETEPKNPEQLNFKTTSDFVDYLEQEIPDLWNCVDTLSISDQNEWKLFLTSSFSAKSVALILNRAKYTMRDRIHLMSSRASFSEDSVEVSLAVAGGHALLKEIEEILETRTDLDYSRVIFDEPLTYTIGEHGQLVLGDR